MLRRLQQNFTPVCVRERETHGVGVFLAGMLAGPCDADRIVAMPSGWRALASPRITECVQPYSRASCVSRVTNPLPILHPAAVRREPSVIGQRPTGTLQQEVDGRHVVGMCRVFHQNVYRAGPALHVGAGRTVVSLEHITTDIIDCGCHGLFAFLSLHCDTRAPT